MGNSVAARELGDIYQAIVFGCIDWKRNDTNELEQIRWTHEKMPVVMSIM